MTNDSIDQSPAGAPDLPADGLGHITESLRGLAVTVDSLITDPANSRQHPDRNIDALKNSLAKFGQMKPVVVRRADRVVMAGNGTLAAAKALGWPMLAAVIVDTDATTAAAFAIADNRTAELATWDWEALGKTIDGLTQDGFNVDLLGFSADELQGIASANYEPPAESDEEFKTTGDYLTHNIKCTAAQYEVIAKAINSLKTKEGSGDISDGRAVELICLDFMA
jgi:hypothetical protein